MAYDACTAFTVPICCQDPEVLLEIKLLLALVWHTAPDLLRHIVEVRMVQCRGSK